jgi:hypothetical protein
MDEIEFGERDETLYEHAKVLRTLVPSPVILDIFQANLRSPSSWDIIIVKARRNTLAEFDSSTTASSCTVLLGQSFSWNPICPLIVPSVPLPLSPAPSRITETLNRGFFLLRRRLKHRGRTWCFVRRIQENWWLSIGTADEMRNLRMGSPRSNLDCGSLRRFVRRGRGRMFVRLVDLSASVRSTNH